MTEQTAQLIIDGKTHELPIVESTTGERAIDVRRLLPATGYITLDSGYMNTGSCASEITYMEGSKGILNYRGYAIEDLAENCSFVEVKDKPASKLFSIIDEISGESTLDPVKLCLGGEPPACLGLDPFR